MSKLIGKMKKSLLGRVTCATLGNRRGGILLEYVVLAVLLTTAIVVAVMYFGKTLRSGMAASAKAVSGQATEAKTEVTDTMRTAAGNTDTKGAEYQKTIATTEEDK